MSMLSAYMNQTASWEYVSTINEYNEATYLTVSIKCRKETGFKLVRNAQGQETTSSAQIFTESAIDVNDKIDGKLVIAVDTQIDLGGASRFRECYLV